MLQTLDNVPMCLCYLIFNALYFLQGTGKEYRLKNEACGVY